MGEGEGGAKVTPEQIALLKALLKWLRREAQETELDLSDRAADALSALLAEREYYRWRLGAIVPLFEEARDALCALSVAQCKLRNIDLGLAERMDRAGTATRADFDALAAPADEETRK
jgi:hypothetical protein